MTIIAFWNVVNCRCEFLKKTAKLITTEECKEIVVDDDVLNNKAISIINKVEKCKPFVASSILFVCVSVILTGIMIYFYVKSGNNYVLPY